MHKNTEAKLTLPAQQNALPSWYGDLLSEVKETVACARLRAQRAVNTEPVQMYWQIGKLILGCWPAHGRSQLCSSPLHNCRWTTSPSGALPRPVRGAGNCATSPRRPAGSSPFTQRSA
ncbi:DUF1016 domain-containing protein [Streptomyces sp. HC44]|uniref:DUF1016 domain-containing protein n=1 Tax=Streptomyces scabichelini TaxID=2711217 RepID=A0A6G4VII2_9ACTN|nr:DUF1016 domain-containing protein [Streptomyces scabichelini]NGO13919.1 DUF1016 domain-containing protein [Streptomyces scabichelini]